MLKEAKRKKPEKPSADFPLTAHNTGRWCKKINGKTRYFGPWDDPQGALRRYKDACDDPAIEPDTFTVRQLLNSFLGSKKINVDTGELSKSSFKDLEETCDYISSSLGLKRAVRSLALADFQKLRGDIAKGKSRPLSLLTLKCELTRCRMVFLYAADLGVALPYRKPLCSPSAKNLRRERAEKGHRMYSAKELQMMLKASKPQLRAMIYLAANCGFGNNDCARLPFDRIDLKKGWHTFPRPKTGAERRCPLWPETVKAIKAAIKVRPKPAVGCERYILLTHAGKCWADEADNFITLAIRKLLIQLKIKQYGFYTIRRTFQTVADTANEPNAVRLIMGHVPPASDMSAVYRQRVYDRQLVNVANHVRGWLLGRIKLD